MKNLSIQGGYVDIPPRVQALPEAGLIGGISNVQLWKDETTPTSPLYAKGVQSDGTSYQFVLGGGSGGIGVLFFNGRDGNVTPQAGDYTTTLVTEGANLYYTQARFDTAFAAKSTTNLSEGSNLYYTQARFDTAFSGKSTTDLTEGSNLYYTAARFNTAFAAKSTADLAEGSNLYFTQARAIASPLTGLSITNSAIVATDTILQAFGKTQGQINANAPLTTKGDLYTFSTANARLGVGINGQFLVADSTQTTGLRWTGTFTNNATGFALSGGTSSRTLTVTSTTTIDQDIAGSASPLWNNVSATNRVRGNAGWLAGVFGQNITTPVVVMGNLNGAASLGAHNNALSAWAPLYIQPENAAFTGFGLSAIFAQTPNATIHGGGSTILGIATSAVADASIYNSQMNIWYDQSNSRIVFKAKSSTGTVTSFPLTASGGTSPLTTKGDLYTFTSADARLAVGSDGQMIVADASQSTGLLWTGAKVRTSSTVDSNGPLDRIICLDSTAGSNLFVIDRQYLQFPITIIWTTGISVPSFQSASGQTINNLSIPQSLSALFNSVTIAKDANNSSNMVIISKAT